MQTQETKLTYGIKGKLISAVAMLLVAIIMVVSSTYAWFTLSTAPEVTGISTAVGANGALEMLLLTQDATGKWDYNDDVVQTGDDVNTYWGNLVDVSGKGDMIDYGLSQISLYPSALNIDGDKLNASYLLNPAYGADGRVTNLVANSVTGTYSGDSFVPNDQYGVRAVGTSSGMTERQLAYRNAVSSASSNLAKARNASANTLETYGGTVGDIAVKKALNGDAAAFTVTEIESLKLLASDLNTKVIPVIEEAYKQYIIAFAASKAVDASSEAAENAYSVVNSFFTSGFTIYDVLAQIDMQFSTELSTSTLNTYITKLAATKASVDAALKGGTDSTGATYSGLNSLDVDSDPNATFTWDQISKPLNNLVKVDSIKVCGLTVTEIREDMDAFVKVAVDYQLNQGGLVVTMASGAGVYADVADHCGNYDAGIELHNIKYGSLNLSEVNARMETATTADPVYLVGVNTFVTGYGAPDKSADDDMPISEFYGYIIDLAFRTNAAESNLLLQTAPKDRIYSDNAEGGETWGKGSTMTFKATAADFTNDQVKALMSSIKVVFFNTDDRTVLAYAKLDMVNATTGADGITANLYLYETVKATKIENAAYKVGENAGNGIVYAAEDGTYYAADLCTVVTDAEVTDGGNIAYDENNAVDVDITLKEGDAVIQALTQNTIAHVSALVYLDGANVTNKDVAATVGQSMTGTMNLQFASSATLVPMDYAEFQNPANNTSGAETSGT